MPVLGGSLVGSNGVFLRALYAAGIKGYYDGLAVHFYTLVLGSLRYLHEVQLQNGDPTPLWLDEFGWSSCWPRQRIQQEQACVTPAGAGHQHRQRLSRARHEPLGSPPRCCTTLQGSRSEDFGVLSETGARKPSFAALRSVFVSPFGALSPVTAHLSHAVVGVLASGSGPVGDYMQLEAFQRWTCCATARCSRWTASTATRLCCRACSVRHLRVSVFQYWLGTARAASASI